MGVRSVDNSYVLRYSYAMFGSMAIIVVEYQSRSLLADTCKIMREEVQFVPMLTGKRYVLLPNSF